MAGISQTVVSLQSGKMEENLLTILEENKIECSFPPMNFEKLKHHYQEIFSELYQRVKKRNEQ